MARFHRAALTLAALAVFAGGARAARAQSLPHLQIETLGQHADVGTVAPHVPFHITIRLTVKEKRTRFDELILGDCNNCAIVGDERIPRVLRSGSEYIERLTLEAIAPGEARLSPAYIDAVDPRSGKALRYSTDPVSVHVSGPAPLDTAERAIRSFFRILLIAFGFGAALFVLIALFVLRGKRRPTPPPQVAPIAPPPPVETASLVQRLVRSGEAFARTRSETPLADLRALLFEAAGVARGATLVDALRGLTDVDRPLRVALLAAERTMFGPAAERESAGDDLLAAVEAYCRAATAKG